MDKIYIFIAIPIILIIWVRIIYNSIITLKNSVKTAYSGIDVQLKRRVDLIPNLINTVKGYAKHEQQVLENITKARSAIMQAPKEDLKAQAQGDKMLSGALKSLFAVSENYPDLKANQNFISLQNELVETEDQIAASRRIYNENVNYFNTKLESIPSNIIASIFNFKKQEFFEANQEDKKLVEVNI